MDHLKRKILNDYTICTIGILNDINCNKTCSTSSSSPSISSRTGCELIGVIVVVAATFSCIRSAISGGVVATAVMLWSIFSDVGGIQSRSDRSINVRARVHYACA